MKTKRKILDLRLPTFYRIFPATWLIFISILFCSMSYSQQSDYPSWTHFSIDPVLPGSSWGTAGPAMGDFDHDGDLDVAIARRNSGEAYWYERINDSIWIPHLMGRTPNLPEILGSASVDVDHDGWADVVFEGVWFRNPGNLAKYPETPWEAHALKAGGHDIVAADIDGNGKEDIVVYDGNKLSWYNTSNALRETVISSGNDDHGGIAPHGYGDIDGDGDMDVVIPGFWFKNPGDGTGNWTRYEWPYHPVPNASYGRSIRAWIADINKDCKNDIVYGNCDTGGSHVYWVENKDSGKTWESHQLADPPTRAGDIEGTGSFHSLSVADFNEDGNPDNFAGEQEDPDTFMEGDGKVAMKPRGLKERGVIWYSNGSRNPEFEIFIIHVNNPGWHDAQPGDVDDDGDIDIVSKVWNADGLTYYADYWRNEFRKK